MRIVRIFLSQVKAEILSFLPYRAMVIFLSVWALVDGVIFSFVWISLARNISFVYTDSQIAFYYFLLSIVAIITGSWCNFTMPMDIRTGKINYFLLRPVPLIYNYLANNVGQKIVKVMIMLLAWVVWFVIISIRFSAPAVDLMTLLIFFVTLVLGLMISFLFDYLISIFSFQFLDTKHVFMFFIRSFSLFFGGYFIPVRFWPEWLQDIIICLPFHFFFSFPIEIILGGYSDNKIYAGLILGISWVMIFLVAIHFAYSKMARKHMAFGG